jgi:SAM-dependent methyltransferase
MNGKCRLRGDDLVLVMDLDEPCVSDFVDHPDQGTRFPLKLGLGPTSGLLQLYDSYPANRMYRQYWYQSGINEAMRAHLAGIVESARAWVSLSGQDVVLDIGCNDGTLLAAWPRSVRRMGIDPSENLAPLARQHADIVATDFFSAEVFRSLEPSRKARVITSIAMFYDLDDPHAFVEDIREVLDPRGLWILELAYAPLVMQENAFDCICHEHLCYYSLDVMQALLGDHRLEVVDVRLNNVNGGSFRVYVAHAGARLDAPVYDGDIGRYRRDAYLAREHSLDLRGWGPYEAFLARVGCQQRRLMEFLARAREEGRTVIGYGASTKGNTLLQYYGITPELLPAIADRSPAKHGKFTAGSRIPIISEEEMRRMRPDFLLALPWHFIPGFVRRERELLDTGTRFVVPLPEFRVVPAA